MVGQLMELVNKVDTKVWLIVAAVMAVIVIIGLIKKVAKIGIIIALVIALATGGSAYVSNTMEKYGVNIDGTYLSVHNSSYDIDIDLRSIDKIEVEKASASEMDLLITSNKGTERIRIKNGLWSLFKGFIKDKGVTIIEAE